jgi:PGM1 C-terminal domain/ATP-grasp domain
VADVTFDALQQRLVSLWKSIERMSQDEQTIVVVPALTVDSEDLKGAKLQAYEERFLFLLLLLRQPRARLVYVTSQPILSSVVDYYLDLLPGVIPSHARKRLFLVAPLDGSARPLSQKILERPRLIRRLRELIIDPERAHLVPYNTTELERDLAVALGIPMYGADPKHFHFGTKTGCRRLFQEEDVPHPIGRENVTSLSDAAGAIAAMRAERPVIEQVLLKLNEGVSGEGNARVDLRDLPVPGSAEEAAAIEARLRDMSFETTTTFDQYVAKLEERGGVVEERITGEEFRSPSVQLRVTPLGKVELLSTHDQLLGGPSGQTYIGCRFPADTAYASQITAEAAKIGARLAAEGVIGRFALDFVTVRRNGSWEPYAIEINLRKGGTTHPFLTLQFLTDGTYDPERAVFTAPSGREKHFVASDHVENEAYRGLTPDDLFDIATRRGLHFDDARQTGVVFHMMAALAEEGWLGLTAVGDSPADADRIYREATAILDEEAADQG